MNLPNILTISRFGLIPVFVLVFFGGHPFLAFGVFILAGVTDVVDGYLARKYKLVTEIGKLLDPLADKMMLLTVFISLLIAGKISWFVFALLLFRDAGMILGSMIFHFRGKKTVQANTLGKLTTVLFYLAILLITFEAPYYRQFLWLVVIFAFITSTIYMIEFIQVNRRAKNKKKMNKSANSYKKGAAASNE